MLCTKNEEGFFVEHAALDETISTSLLARADRSVICVENGCVVIRADNGTWWYEIVGFPNNHEVQTSLKRYDRAAPK